MITTLAYGNKGLPVELPDHGVTVIEPAHLPGLPDERQALVHALDHPIGCRALRDWLKPGMKICLTFTDITRATPNERLIPWLLDYLAPHAPKENITLLNSLGTHRPNSQAELERLLGPAVARNFRIVDNQPENEAAHVQLGATRDGAPALISRHLVEADARIVTGFIEPHFFAGFSGGPKGIIPGVAHLRTVMSNHGPHNIGHPNAAFGVTEGNPLWEEIRDIALRVGPVFLVNVALNTRREITGVFAGDLLAAHRAGTEFVKRASMRAVPAPYDIVITSNSGHPLDLNLYQGVKGVAAAARIVKPGGLIILACECADGLPFGSAYEKLLRQAATPAELLTRIAGCPQVQPDQWQVQIQAQILRRARVMVHSALPADAVRAAHFEPCPDIAEAVRQAITARGPETKIAVLPYGPLTIPYLEQ